MAKARRFKYVWLSFGQNDKENLSAYITQMAKQGYEISRIARFYMRFERKQNVHLYPYLQSYRRHFFGHLYWYFGDEPHHLPVSFQSRRTYYLTMLVILGALLLGSLGLYLMPPAFMYYEESLYMVTRYLPVILLSFIVDYFARLFETKHTKKNALRYARVRSLGLGANMFFRYGILIVLILSPLLRKLYLQVAFVTLLVLSYMVLSNYLPSHNRKLYFLLACGVSILGCMFMLAIPSVHVDESISGLELIHLEERQAVEIRHIHRFHTSSRFVLWHLYQKEDICNEDKEVLAYLTQSYSYCKDEAFAKELFMQVVSREAGQWLEENRLFLSDANRLYGLQGRWLYYMEGENLLENASMMLSRLN